MRHRIHRIGAIGLVSLLWAGCADKKTCYFQCYEPALDGFGTGCATTIDLTEDECSAMFCSQEGEKVRHAWGDAPAWCGDETER